MEVFFNADIFFCCSHSEEVLEFCETWVRLPAFAAMEVFLADKIHSNYYSQGGGPGVCETLSLDTCFAALELFFK